MSYKKTLRNPPPNALCKIHIISNHNVKQVIDINVKHPTRRLKVKTYCCRTHVRRTRERCSAFKFLEIVLLGVGEKKTCPIDSTASSVLLTAMMLLTTIYLSIIIYSDPRGWMTRKREKTTDHGHTIKYNFVVADNESW